MDRYYFNKIFKEERLKRNMNQVAFGKKLGVMRQSISLLERNKCIPPLRMVIRFCRVFNYNIEFVPLASPSL
jgi:DNA-binding XRE family transcriptional regulator